MIGWSEVVEMYRRLSEQAQPYRRDVTIVGAGTWQSLLERSSDVEREALWSLVQIGSVIISPHLPESVAGYRYTSPPVDA